MEPHVDFHWLNVSQVFPKEQERWDHCALHVPPCGYDEMFILKAELRLIADEPQSRAIELLSIWSSPYGVLYLCLLNLSLFRENPAELRTLYRKEPAHPFPCPEAPALLGAVVGALLDYEQTLDALHHDKLAYVGAWEPARRILEERARTFLVTPTRRPQQGTRVTKAEQHYAAMVRLLDQTEQKDAKQVSRIVREQENDCRQDLIMSLHAAFMRHGPSDPNFRGKPLYWAVATILIRFGLATHDDTEKVASNVRRFLDRHHLVDPRRKPRAK